MARLKFLVATLLGMTADAALRWNHEWVAAPPLSVVLTNENFLADLELMDRLGRTTAGETDGD